MASSSAPVRPARYLSLFLILLIGVYLLVFLTGNKQAKPKLGIDLQGGTRVTLTARTPDGSRPTREALGQAQQIISARVNGLGVSGSEVVIDGDNLVITVPGNDGNEARNLGQTARLYIRPVIDAVPIPQAGQQPPGDDAGAAAADRCRGCRRDRAGLPPGAPPERLRLKRRQRSPRRTPPPGQPAPQPRPYPQDPPPPSPTPLTGAARACPWRSARRARRFPRHLTRARTWPTASPSRSSCGRTRRWLQMLALQRADGSRGARAPTRSPATTILEQPLVTCSTDRTEIYYLDKSIISGDQIDNASVGFRPTGRRSGW